MYLTNLTDSQHEIIKGILNDQRWRKYEFNSIINAVLYISKGGIQWQLLPKDFPSWQLVYYYFRKWLLCGIWNKLPLGKRSGRNIIKGLAPVWGS